MNEGLSILSVGCGNMGGALLESFLDCQPKPNMLAISQSEKNIDGVGWQSANTPLPPDFAPDIILLAVKPQVADDILPKYQKYASSIFISIMAGKDLDYLQKILGADKKIIRAMPNMLVKVRKGFTSYCMNENCNQDDEKNFTALFAQSGMVEKIAETNYDIMTSLFGCTPGFILCMAEAMQRVAHDKGQMNIDNEKLRDMIKNIINGSMEMVGDKSFADSYKQVASRGGMTEAGLEMIKDNDGGFEKLWLRAINAADARAKKL